MIESKKDNVDVCNAFNIMENEQILDALHFTKGTGVSNMYLWNWTTPALISSQIGKPLN